MKNLKIGKYASMIWMIYYLIMVAMESWIWSARGRVTRLLRRLSRCTALTVRAGPSAQCRAHRPVGGRAAVHD